MLGSSALLCLKVQTHGTGHHSTLPQPQSLAAHLLRCPQDLRHMPALQDLVAAFMRAMTGGDTSQWQAALQVRLAACCTQQLQAGILVLGSLVCSELYRSC